MLFMCNANAKHTNNTNGHGGGGGGRKIIAQMSWIKWWLEIPIGIESFRTSMTFQQKEKLYW